MNPNCINLFVYGSLRKGFRDAAYNYVSKYFDFVSQGSIWGDCFLLNNIPVVVQQEMKYPVPGDLYTLKDKAEFDYVMLQLDDYEGLNVMHPERSMYKRSLVTVEYNNSSAIAWAYLYNDSTEDLKPFDPAQLPVLLNLDK